MEGSANKSQDWYDGYEEGWFDSKRICEEEIENPIPESMSWMQRFLYKAIWFIENRMKR